MNKNIEQELREIEADAFHTACFIDAMGEDEDCFHITYSEDDDVARMYVTNPERTNITIIQEKDNKIERLTFPVEEMKKATERFIKLVGTVRA